MSDGAASLEALAAIAAFVAGGRDRGRDHHRDPAVAAAHCARQAQCALLAHRADAAGRRHCGDRRHHHRGRRRSLFVRIGGFRCSHSLLPLLVAVIVIAAVGAADDIRPIGVAPRFLLQAFSVALVIFALPDELRVAPFMPIFIERLLLTIGWPLVRQSGQLHGRPRLDDGRRSRAGHGGAGDLRRVRIPAGDADDHQPRLVRRHDRLCLFQPAGRQAFPRRCRQLAGRSVARLAAG